jgi:probable F420-dependent oxidoreductase
VTGIGLCLPQLGEHVTPDVVREFCTDAERLGYASLWVQDHFMYPLAPLRGYAGRDGVPIPEPYRSVLAPTELLTYAAACTSRVRLGTSVLVQGNHWPAPLAQRLATIDVLSGGRLVVGLGAGWNAEEHTASGTSIRGRARRMDDFVEALLACWGPDPVEHHSESFEIPPSIMRPKPVQRPRPTLLSGMSSPAGLERTRRWFDGWNPASRSVAQAAETVARLNADRPAAMAPLEVWFRVFVQWPNGPAPAADHLDQLVAQVREARAAGFAEVVVEHSFWEGITSPEAWAAVPRTYAALVEAATG